jgi:hypothetical protein
MFSNFSQKSRHLRDNVGKYGTGGQTTDNDTTRPMRCVCWINKAINVHLEYVIVIGFFFTPTLVTRKRLNVKLILALHVLSFFKTTKLA